MLALTVTLQIHQKLFRLDKNYILKEAQGALQDDLLFYLVEYAKLSYMRNFNPLGLEDDTILKIKKANSPNTHHLEDLYAYLAGIYRYKYGNNQLEFLFDGTDHYDKYKKDWEKAFKNWLKGFCHDLNFLKAVLEASVFYPEHKKAALACNRLKAFINHQFAMKIYKYKGIVEMEVA